MKTPDRVPVISFTAAAFELTILHLPIVQPPKRLFRTIATTTTCPRPQRNSRRQYRGRPWTAYTTDRL